jgi:hypothetical protein
MVARSKMDFLAVLFLALGVSVFSTMALKVWYTPDRLYAVWWGCAGSICLVVFCFVRLHVYVSENLAQPVIELIPPSVASHFRWDSAVASAPVIKAPTDNLRVGASSQAIFKLNNLEKIFAADISIEWQAPAYDPAQLTSSSPRLRRYVRNIDPGGFELLAPQENDLPVLPVLYPSAAKATSTVPFLNRPVEIPFPMDVLSRAIPILIANLPDQPGADTFDIEFPATVTWNIPERGKPKAFIVTAHVRNTKKQGDAAIMDADIVWAVSPSP